MNKSALFFVRGNPVGQPRPRACNGPKHARVYDPGTANAWKIAVEIEARKCGVKFGKSPVSVSMNFYFDRPKSHFKRDGSLKENAPRNYVSKPDIDNLLKAAMDAIVAAGVIDDDRYVYHVASFKNYSMSYMSAGIPSGMNVSIGALEGGE